MPVYFGPHIYYYRPLPGLDKVIKILFLKRPLYYIRYYCNTYQRNWNTLYHSKDIVYIANLWVAHFDQIYKD